MAAARLARFEESDPSVLAPARAASLLASAPWRRFAVIGDSLSAGASGPTPGYASLGWPVRVADVLRRVHPDLAYLNTAVVGVTSAEVLAHQTAPMTAFAPDLVHVSSGANDLFVSDPDFAAVEQTLRRVFALAAGTGAVLTTFTLGRAFVVRRFPDFTDRVRQLNDIVRAPAAEHDAVLVDVADHPVNDRADLLSADHIHFAAAGQAVLATEVVHALAATLGQPKSRTVHHRPQHPRRNT
jgi:lysophospholipase L1-like esterase